MDNPRKPPKITLEEFLALNDEMIALLRAGVPLELGLAELGWDRAGVLGRLSGRMAAQLQQGKSLAEVLAESGLPRAYRAIVEAGLRAGRLTAALEGVSKMAWKMAELRRRIGLALVYPLIVLTLAYGLFLFLVTFVMPRLKHVLSNLGLSHGSLQFFIWFWWAWLWWVLPVLFVLFLIWWWRSGREGWLSDEGRPLGIARLCPGVKRAAQLFQYSQFADLLALLVEHDVPLQDAVVLASDATTNAALRDAARSIADLTSRGFTVPSLGPADAGFPPFLHWLITRREEQAGLVSALKSAADMYHRRALLITDWIQFVFPMLAAVIIGGGATLLYTLTVFLPLTELLRQLADPLL